MSQQNRRKAISLRDVARSSTAQSFKGLEFPHVMLSGFNRVRSREGDDEESVRRLIYVAITRATDHLSQQSQSRLIECSLAQT